MQGKNEEKMVFSAFVKKQHTELFYQTGFAVIKNFSIPMLNFSGRTKK